MGLFYYFCLQPDCIDSTYPKPHFISGPSLSLSASIYMPHVSISTFTLDVLYSIPCLSYFQPSLTFHRPFFSYFMTIICMISHIKHLGFAYEKECDACHSEPELSCQYNIPSSVAWFQKVSLVGEGK